MEKRHLSKLRPHGWSSQNAHLSSQTVRSVGSGDNGVAVTGRQVQDPGWTWIEVDLVGVAVGILANQRDQVKATESWPQTSFLRSVSSREREEPLCTTTSERRETGSGLPVPTTGPGNSVNGSNSQRRQGLSELPARTHPSLVPAGLSGDVGQSILGRWVADPELSYRVMHTLLFIFPGAEDKTLICV